MTDVAVWKKCSSCWKPIGFDTDYFGCSVSTCNRPRMTRHFCSWACWDAHLPDARHRSADPVKRHSPTKAAYEAAQQASPRPANPRAPRPASPPRLTPPATQGSLQDASAFNDVILVVASRLKEYVKDRSDMRTSKTALEALSARIRELCDQAILSAQHAERKTVMDRDFSRPPASAKGDTVLVVVSKLKGYVKHR